MTEPVEESVGLDVAKLEELVDKQPSQAKKIHASAMYYCTLKWPVIPIEPGGKALPSISSLKKRNINKGLTYSDASFIPEQVNNWFDPVDGDFRGYNIGIVCGKTVSVIDLDVDDKTNGVTEYMQVVGAFEDDNAPVQITPNGGLHLVFLHTEDFRTRTGLLPGVDVRGQKRKGGMGSHIVAYPSYIGKGKDKKTYNWHHGGLPAIAPDPLINTLNAVVDIQSGKPIVPGGRGNENVDDDDYYPDAPVDEIQRALDHITSLRDDYDGWIKIGMALHSWSNGGHDGFDLWHEWSKEATNYKGEKDCNKHWQSFDSADPSGVGIGTIFFHARQMGFRKPGQHSASLEDLQFTDKGHIKNSSHNLVVLLRSEEFKAKFGGHLQFDYFSDKVVAGGVEFANEGWTKISSWLSFTFQFERAPVSVREFGRMVAKDNGTDLLHEYIANLVWDGEDRLEYLHDTLCADNDYKKVVVNKWLIGGIARALQPGCGAGHMLVLHGKQGIGKSRFFRALVPDKEWFSDSSTFKFHGTNSSRDEEMKLQGHWIVEIAELAGIMKSDFSDLKQFLTLQAPRIRRPYDTDVIALKRRCIFGGSTNLDAVVNDSTGSRRFAFLSYPKGHRIDVDWVGTNAAQIWAQAKDMYDKGMVWWLEDAEVDEQVEENESYRAVHPWTFKVLEWAKDKSRFNSGDVLTHAIGKDTGQWNISDENQVRGILQAEGWEKKKTKIKNEGGGYRYPKGIWHNPVAEIDDEFLGRLWSSSDDERY